MRVLLLRRQSRGGITNYSDDLSLFLSRMGVQGVVHDATNWIPNETGPRPDRVASKQLKEIAADFDAVHAFGYRAAWACAEAFGAQEAWFATAYDEPKTTNPELIRRLNKAQKVFCASRAVYSELMVAGVQSLEMVYPGVRDWTSPSREAIFQELGLNPEKPLLVSIGRFVRERGFDLVVEAMEAVWQENPEVTLLLSGDGPDEAVLRTAIQASSMPEQILLKGWQRRPRELLAAADLVVIPSRRCGFSLTAAEAMSQGACVLASDAGGLLELIEPHVTGFIWPMQQESLASKLTEALSMPLTMETMGQAAAIRAQDLFDSERNAEQIVNAYRSIAA